MKILSVLKLAGLKVTKDIVKIVQDYSGSILTLSSDENTFI